MQRAYDNVIHDVALQNLPVTFCLDRGGLVGEDGATHHGVFDLAYFACIPNMIVAAPMTGLVCAVISLIKMKLVKVKEDEEKTPDWLDALRKNIQIGYSFFSVLLSV